MIDLDSNMITCPSCGAIIQLEETNVDYGAKDEKGQIVSRETAEHMAKHRVRCATCTKNFCAGCKEEPYHLGRSCEEAANFKAALKCRYCWEELQQPSISDEEAFQDVCRTESCIELMKASCNKVHQCGHPCRGFANETQCMPCLNADCLKNHNRTYPQF